MCVCAIAAEVRRTLSKHQRTDSHRIDAAFMSWQNTRTHLLHKHASCYRAGTPIRPSARRPLYLVFPASLVYSQRTAQNELLTPLVFGEQRLLLLFLWHGHRFSSHDSLPFHSASLCSLIHSHDSFISMLKAKFPLSTSYLLTRLLPLHTRL